MSRNKFGRGHPVSGCLAGNKGDVYSTKVYSKFRGACQVKKGQDQRLQNSKNAIKVRVNGIEILAWVKIRIFYVLDSRVGVRIRIFHVTEP
jgi:hypothetical protein